MSGSNDVNETSSGVLRPTDDEARRLAQTLLRTARYGALASIESKTGHPLATRVAVSTDLDGSPVILTSTLSSHTAAIVENSKCSLLVGEPGKGDPLAYPRCSLFCAASKIERSDGSYARVIRRYLAKHPKAQLYVDFGDFSFFKLNVERASLNGGFGRAFELEATDIVSDAKGLDGWAALEESAVEHMNEDHKEAVKLFAEVLVGAEKASWEIVGIDPLGIDLKAKDRFERLWFQSTLDSPSELRMHLASLAKQARAMV